MWLYKIVGEYFWFLAFFSKFRFIGAGGWLVGDSGGRLFKRVVRLSFRLVIYVFKYERI